MRRWADRPIHAAAPEEHACVTRRLGTLFGLALAVSLAAVQPSGGATANGKIAFITTRDSGEIYTIEANGTGEARLTQRDPDGFGPAWSPDGSKIAFTGTGRWMNLWLMDRDGADPHPIADLRVDSGPGFDPDWSPSGGRLVFSSGYRIYTVRPNGTGLRRIGGAGTYDAWDPAWSPAGGAIAFTLNGRIYRMRPDGSRQQRLGVGDHADWSPNGRRIVFTVWQTNGRGDVYVMNADGSNRRRLMNTPRADESRPAWSPGGAKIAFQRGRSVWLMDRDGSDQRRIARNASAPAWSPGGSFLTFSRLRTTEHFDIPESASGIFTMRRDGNGVTRVLTPEFDRDVTFSPDGTHMAFTSVRPFSQSGVYVADADGTNESFLHSGESPAWSPDGSQVILRDADGLYVVYANGTDALKLSSPVDADGDALQGVVDPAWRPDGAAVSFVAAEPDGCAEVYTMELDGENVTPVTAAACAPQVGEYDWAPGGASIVFAGSTCVDFECTGRIFSAPVPGGVPTELTAAEADVDHDVEPAISPDGTKIAFTRFDFSGLASWDVWVMNVDGSNETKLTSGGADLAPAWQTLPD
jgi:Tol biopolymer transport system component